MTCTHLHWLEQALADAGFRETFRGMAWSENCREWVYFDVQLNIEAILKDFPVPACVEVRENSDPRSGLERGFYCKACLDAVMGRVSGTENRFPRPES